MANVLTDLAADIYKAADMVGHEAVGFIPSVTINGGSEAAAQGDTVRSHAPRAATVNTSATPSMTIPEGEDMKHVNIGSGFDTIYGDQIAQAFRGIVNSVEEHIATIAYQNASRAVGVAGTTPFSGNFDAIAEARQILFDNGIPVTDGMISLVINSAAGVNLRNLAQLQKANESASDTLLRQGVLLDLQGAAMRESGQVQAHTKGTETLLDSNRGIALGDTSIPLDGGDGGSLLSGDVVTFAGDTNKYMVNTGFTAAAGTMVIGETGLLETLATATEMTIGADFTANIMLHRNAVELAMRPLAKPNGGDAAVDVMDVVDPHSGLTFQISAYKGYNKAMFDVTMLYKAKAWNSKGIAVLMG